MPTYEHGVRQVCLSAFRELGFHGPLRGRTPSIWQTAGPSLFPTPSSPDCPGPPPGGTNDPEGGPRPPPLPCPPPHRPGPARTPRPGDPSPGGVPRPCPTPACPTNATRSPTASRRG